MTTPFDDLTALLETLPEPAAAAAAEFAGTLGDRYGSLGALGALGAWMAGWQGRARPQVQRPILALYAAAHDGATEPAAAVRRRLEGFAAGEGPLSTVARQVGAGVEAFDLAVDRPTPDAALRASMSERECAATVAFGMEALAKSPDLLIVGETAAGADRAASALALALFGGPAQDWAAGAEAEWAERAAARAHAETGAAPLALLRQLGGRETAAMAGAILAARIQRVPVLLDGYAATVAGAVLHRLAPDALDHCRSAHLTTHPGHARLLEHLGLDPLLALGLQRSEGLGGLAAVGLAKAACALVGA